MNNFNFLGHLVFDPKAINTQNGTPMTTFRVAIDANDKKTLFLNCVSFGKLATTISTHLKKGKQISATGSLSPRTYTTKDGEQREELECNVAHFWFVKGTKQNDDDAAQHEGETIHDAHNNAPRFKY